MPYPKKVNIPTKQNANPITDISKQVAADEINQIAQAINENALFHGLHATFEALENAHTTPPLGAWAFLADGTKAECKTIEQWSLVTLPKNGFLVNQLFQWRSDTAGSNNWVYLFNDDMSFESLLLAANGGADINGLLTRNDIVAFFNAPKKCKLKKVSLQTYKSKTGTISLGIIKHKKLNDKAFNGFDSTNGDVLLEENLGIRENNKRYIDEFENEIADVVIEKGEDVCVVLKNTESLANLVEQMITLYFEEV